MVSTASLAKFAALISNPARAGMLRALMNNHAMTSTELAVSAGISPQTASGHLVRLSAECLLRVEKRGRYRHYRLASHEVSLMLQGLMQAAATLSDKRRKLRRGREVGRSDLAGPPSRVTRRRR
jgi:DNA-binding transcriptional ArsR family regulator